MGLFSFDTGVSALLSAQRAMHAIGHNVANVNTAGFARRQIQLTPLGGVQIGAHRIGMGVDLASVGRVVDESLETRLRAARASFARVETEHTFGLRLESLFLESEGEGIAGRASALFASFSHLAAAPGDVIYQSEVVSTGVSLAEGLRELRGQTDSLSQEVQTRLTGAVDEFNGLARQVADLTRRLRASEASGGEASDLRDEIARVASRLAELAGAELVFEGSGGLPRVLIGGREVAANGRALPLVVSNEEPGLELGGSSLRVEEGHLGALQALRLEVGQAASQDLDRLAAQWILEVNRLHARSVPSGAGFRSLVATQAVRDGDGDGVRHDERLSAAGLPFEMRNGQLTLRVADEVTGVTELTRIAIDPEGQTVGDFVQALNGVDHLSAWLDETGRLHVRADEGHRFDFTGQPVPNPDVLGAFGGSRATLTTSGREPFALTVPSSFQVALDGAPPVTVTFGTTTFTDPNQVSAAELAAVLSAQVPGLSASANAGSVSVQSPSSGANGTLRLTDGPGSPLVSLGLSTALERGSDVAVAPRVHGRYAGEGQVLHFVAEGDGDVGSASDLLVGVFDDDGTRVTTLNLGASYEPGKPVEILPGLEVEFGSGTISATHGDRFRLELVGDSDTSDVLPAFGLAAFFTGRDASSIAVSSELREDPTTLHFTLPGEEGSAQVLQGMLALEHLGIDELGGAQPHRVSPPSRAGDRVRDTG